MKPLEKQKELILLPIRLAVGFGFVAHGYAKLERGPEKFAVLLQALGIPAPHVTAWVTSLLELVGGIGLMAGVAVVPLTAPLSAIMLTALFSVHLRYGFSSIRLVAVAPEGPKFGPIGYELNLLYLAALLSLAIGGAGAASLDGYLKRIRRARSEHPAPSALDI